MLLHSTPLPPPSTTTPLHPRGFFTRRPLCAPPCCSLLPPPLSVSGEPSSVGTGDARADSGGAASGEPSSLQAANRRHGLARAEPLNLRRRMRRRGSLRVDEKKRRRERKRAPTRPPLRAGSFSGASVQIHGPRRSSPSRARLSFPSLSHVSLWEHPSAPSPPSPRCIVLRV